MSNKELLEKIQQGLNNLEKEWLGNYTGDEEWDEEVALDSYSVAIERFQGLIDGFKEIVAKDSASEDLDELVISLEETIGTSPHSREVIKEYLQKAVEKSVDAPQDLSAFKVQLKEYLLEEGWSKADPIYLDEAVDYKAESLLALIPSTAIWTEEDEKMFGSIRSTISMYMSNPSLPEEIRDIHKEEVEWLDGLYDRGL